MSAKQSDAKPKQEIYHSFVSGGIAGIIAKSSIAPIERIKLIFLTSEEKFKYSKGIQKGLEIYRQEGISHLWRGNLMACGRTFFYAAIVEGFNTAIRSLRLAADPFPRS